MTDPNLECMRKAMAEYEREDHERKQRMIEFTRQVNEDLDRIMAAGKPDRKGDKDADHTA